MALKREAASLQAAFALSNKIGTQAVECQPKDQDRYGPIVAVCWVGGEDINAWMVARIAVEQDAAIIVVTHDEMILDRFDHIFRLRDGRLEKEPQAVQRQSQPVA